jgi:hypothetical protein
VKNSDFKFIPNSIAIYIIAISINSLSNFIMNNLKAKNPLSFFPFYNPFVYKTKENHSQKSRKNFFYFFHHLPHQNPPPFILLSTKFNQNSHLSMNLSMDFKILFFQKKKKKMNFIFFIKKKKLI